VPLDRDPSFDSFEEPRALFRWDIRELGTRARLRSETYREHVTQYDESDFDFVTRLFAEEGLSYYVEHGGRDSVLTITDAAGEVTVAQTPLHARLQGDHNLLVGGASGRSFPQEVILSYRTSEALRSRAVRLRGYRPDTPRLLAEAFESSTPADPAAEGESGHYAYPAGPGDPATAPWQHRAHSLGQRFESEAHLRSGSATLRSLHAGVRLHVYAPHDWPFDPAAALVDLEGSPPPQGALAEEVVILSVEMRAHEAGFDMSGAEAPSAEPGFHASFVALPMAFRYRPAWPAAKPRIHGLQEAIVTAEEHEDGREINTNAEGDVRVRFPWDQRPKAAGVPSSRWVRVSQAWSGTSYGAVWNPRVDQLVVCAFRDGDPDDPVVVGRAYSKQMPAPDPVDQLPTVSRFKSQSSPYAAGYGDKYNELLFEDAAGSERLELTACRDMLVKVGRDIDVLVKRDGSVTVERNAYRKIGGTEWTEVSRDYRLEVGGTLSVSAGKIEVKSAKGIVVQDGTGVTVDAPQVTVSAGEIVLTTGSASIKLSGGNIDIVADGNVTVNGALVKLN
jgi:type VI secretion system secreted protein VgrG